jgi:thiol-disulfide isomerase/thioredoxin
LPRAAVAALLVVAFVGALLGTRWRAWLEPTPEDTPPTSVIGPAALFATALPDLQGKMQPIGRWQGQIVVLNFWATWCAPCRREIPAFMRVRRKFADKGVEFVGIAIDTARNVSAYVREMGLDYPTLVSDDAGMILANRAGDTSEGLPYTVILDRDGRIRTAHLGPYTEVVLEQRLRVLLDDAQQHRPKAP